ncbi:MAG: hypothetical protein D6798_07490 [Deltaproteobacteria bacterium]|nr:MAG: hypothetical protein D6798_07490 [Deltaproteobacteria bacterium]
MTDWLAEYWTFPVPAQGDAPPDWTPLEQRLDPDACGTCHPAQLADWRESWHHLAMGPGVLGQIVDWDGTDDRLVHQCQTCHAPLTEQHARLQQDDTWVDNSLLDEDMRAQGLTCAGCHVRQHQRYGPPREGRDVDESGRALAEGPHDGFIPRPEFQSSAFCARCHDFRPSQRALNGKLLQETGEEWRRTAFAAEGRTCQSCHMPEGRHLWKGIHDKDIVASGVEIRGGLQEAGSLLTPVTASLTLTNTGVGHRLPTYTTPEIKLILVQVDADDNEIARSRREGSVARRIKPDLSKELFDTRLLPGESYTLPYAVRRQPGAVAVVARVEVWPDEAYRRFYEIKLRRPENHPKGEAMLREALQNSIDSRYTLWEERWPLP